MTNHIRFRFGSMLLAVFLFCGMGVGQTQKTFPDNTAAQPSHGRKLRLGMWGHILLPEGYRAYETDDLRDAWFGYIVSADDKVRINWTAGMVVTPFQEGEDKFVWVKSEKLSKITLQYGLKRTAEGELIAATLPGLNLWMSVKEVTDLNLFLEIARSYKIEACLDCVRPLPEPKRAEY